MTMIIMMMMIIIIIIIMFVVVVIVVCMYVCEYKRCLCRFILNIHSN
jgi:hypothetical protein